MSALINFSSLNDISGGMTKLPTWQNKPVWTASLKSGAAITIEGTEEWFREYYNKQRDKR